MKYELKKIDIVLIISLIFIIISGIVAFTIYHQKGSNLATTPKKNITEIINNFKNSKSNLNLVYESSNIKDFKSLVYEENGLYESFLIDNQSGEIKTFFDYLKNPSLFETKLTELLNLKYPYFVVEALSSASRNYYVKENAVEIYFSNYTLEVLSEPLTLTINYNELKDNLNFTPVFDPTYENEDGFNYTSDKKTIAITFDDGPSSRFNPLILETLKENKAHATFFMVGQMMNSCPSCVINTYNSGNEIGSHTYEHLNIKTHSTAKVKESLTKTDDIYYSLTNDHIKLLRPPYGAYSKSNLENIANPLIIWNLDTEDWRYRDVNHITEYIKNNVSDGSIILMHELYETSYEALKEILPWLYLNGYQVVSVSELARLHNRTLEAGNAYLSLKMV